MERLGPETIKQLTGKAMEILARMNKVDGMLQELKEEIQKNFGDAPEPSPLRTKKEVCQFLKISIVTLDKLIANGSIKTLKIGGKSVRIHERELQSFISN
jgi:excisionase family DNA binding protein